VKGIAMHEGTTVAERYRLLELIGAGGMGEVWRATDLVLGRTVAIKMVLPSLDADPDFGRRFLAEARAMASVHHPGVVAIHDFGQTRDPDAGRYRGTGWAAYIVMEFVAGESLSQLINRVGRLSPAMTMDLISQTGQALQAVHNHGIVHRDIKPANLIVRPDGTVALTDFGIAAGSNAIVATQPGTVLGTPSYLSPEQILGQPASARSDVYALGLVAYECLAGQKPFVAEQPFGAALQRVHRAAPPLPPDVPPPVAGVVSRALATDPAQRWPTAAEFALAADRAARGAPQPAAPRGGRRRWPLAAAAAVVVLLAGGTTILWAARSPARPGAPGVPSAGTQAQRSSGPPVPAGFVACGEALCPAKPMCWRGLIQQGDRPYPPGAEACTSPHYWETFAATYVPDDVSTDRELTMLMTRSDIAAICSAATMAARSRDRNHTKGWGREAWAIPVDASTLLVHCLAESPDGETSGAAFGSG
jgi:eukaryotic-like serine/threonine-protein kinase